MPSVKLVKRARKAQGKCGKCNEVLSIGSPYRWWKFRYGGRYVRCTKSECFPRPSELTQSEFRSAAYSIQENNEDAVTSADDVDALESLRDDIASQIEEEVVSSLQDKLDEIESGFGHTEIPIYGEMEERKEAFEGWQQEVEGVDFEEFDAEEGGSDKGEWLEEQRSNLMEALNNCPE